jgi:phosphotransferase system  glucose/maltose/N-acetylglucosamine-specific IIC component
MSATTVFYEGFKKHRKVFIAVLMMPVIGMIAVIPIVIWRAPKNMVLVVALTFFLIVQYTVTIFFMIKRIDRLTQDALEKTTQNIEPESPGNNLLPPEE